MFDFLRSKKSLVRQRLQEHAWVRRSWFEWSLEDGAWLPILIVEMQVPTDPQESDFRASDLDEIGAIVRKALAEQPIANLRVRMIPRMYEP